MTNVSKEALSPAELKKIFNQLAKIIASLDSGSAPGFISDLLGPEEHIMLAKRFCAVMMYMEGNSSYRVWQLLHMSPTTAERIRLDYEKGRYDNIVSLLQKKRRDYTEFWEVLNVILHAGMPPRGRGRWKSAIHNITK